MSKFENTRALNDWFERVKGDRTATERVWRDIDENCFGMRNFTDHTKGTDRSPQIYDTTALFSNQLLAGAIHGMMTNPSSQWFEPVPADMNLLEDQEVRGWFQEVVSPRMAQVFNTASSGFTTSIAETYLDIPAYGMATLSVEAHARFAIKFTARDLNETYCELDDDGNIDIIFREIPMTVRTFALRYPDPIDEIKMVARALHQDMPETKITVIELIARSDDPYAGTSPFRKAWTIATWTVDSMSNGRPSMVALKGFNEKPILTPRWSVRSGETYGFGSGWISLADAKMLNVMQLTIIKAGMKAADPPLLVSNEAVLSGIRTHPGGVNYVQDRPGVGGAPEAIRPLKNDARVDIAFELIKHKVQSVQNAYWSQILQMFADPRMTATQVIELANQTQRLMAPMLGRLQQELLEPMLNRVFNIMLDTGWFGRPPMAMSGQQVDITYISPITRSQKQHEAVAVIQTYQAAQMISEVTKSGDVLDLLDHDENLRMVAKANALPIRALKDQEAVQAARAERAQLAQQEQGMEQAGQGAAILGQLAQAKQQQIAA